MVHLTKAIIKKYGISKKAWAVARGGHAHSSGKSSMPKKRSARRYGRRLKRRFSKAKAPFEMLIAGAAIPFTPAARGWATPYDYAMQGNITGIMHNLKNGFLGIDADQSFDLFRTLNPFDMDRARYTKMLIYAGIIGSIRRKITGRYTAPLFKKIPIIGRIVS
jgi:hypothetical protein